MSSATTTNAQARTCPMLAGTTQAFPCALHADLGLVAEYDRTLLCDLTETESGEALPGLEQLIMAIGHYIDRHNESPKPFIWTAKANDILEKFTRARAALNK